jgi:hypothetical protein
VCIDMSRDLASDLWIEDILQAHSGGLPPRFILLAALWAADRMADNRKRGWHDDTAAVAIEHNAWKDGWELGVDAGDGGGITHQDRFTPEELQTVIRPGRYFAARDHPEPAQDDETRFTPDSGEDVRGPVQEGATS